MAKHAKTLQMIDQAYAILAAVNPMTVRQVYYQLVSRHALKNSQSRYDAVCNALRDARLEGVIPWEWIEDRTRRPRKVPMWKDLTAFAQVAEQYRRDVWATQPRRLEVWLEKDALSGIFEEALNPYGVTLNVGRGYDGWSSIHNAANRFGSGHNVTILYFGDFDPSGEDMVRSLGDRLERLGSTPEIIKVSLTLADIEQHSLPPDFTKTTDTRAAGHIAKYGKVSSVELDALPTDILQARLAEEVEQRIDLGALATIKTQESHERVRLMRALQKIGK